MKSIVHVSVTSFSTFEPSLLEYMMNLTVGLQLSGVWDAPLVPGVRYSVVDEVKFMI